MTPQYGRHAVPLRCVSCGKRPDELEEYVDMAELENLSPDEYVWQEEGTLNQENGHFYCSSCYVHAGMPLGVAP